MEDAVKCRAISFLDGTLQLFRHQIASSVLYQFIEFYPQQPANTAGVEIYVKNSVNDFAYFDPFSATTAVGLWENCTDVAGSHRQNLFYKTFEPYAANKSSLFIEKAGRSVHDWAPQNLEVSTISVHADLTSTPALYLCKDTVDVFVRSVNQRFIAVSSD